LETNQEATKDTRGNENIYENFFVFFVSFVVKLIYGCGHWSRCVLCDLRGERFYN
jgi:hypothetical protein